LGQLQYAPLTLSEAQGLAIQSGIGADQETLAYFDHYIRSAIRDGMHEVLIPAPPEARKWSGAWVLEMMEGVAQTQQDRGWSLPRSRTDGRVLTFVLEARVAAPEDVDLVQWQAQAQAPEGSVGREIGYGINPNLPSFGYRREHQGSFSLGEWARAVGLDLKSTAAPLRDP